MSFECLYKYEFTIDGETKPIRQEFKSRKICALFDHNKIGQRTVRFAVSHNVLFDGKEAVVEDNFSSWVCKSNRIHRDGGPEIYSTDYSLSDYIMNSIDGIISGESQGETGGWFIQFLFDRLEVETLGTESIFLEHFPKWFKSRKKFIEKQKMKLVKNSMDS